MPRVRQMPLNWPAGSETKPPACTQIWEEVGTRQLAAKNGSSGDCLASSCNMADGSHQGIWPTSRASIENLVKRKRCLSRWWKPVLGVGTFDRLAGDRQQ